MLNECDCFWGYVMILFSRWLNLVRGVKIKIKLKRCLADPVAILVVGPEVVVVQTVARVMWFRTRKFL